MPSPKHRLQNQGNVIDAGSMVPKALVAGIGGAVAAMGWFSPYSSIILILGMTIIFYQCHSAQKLKEVIFVGFVGALLFFAIINRPLASAYGWGGGQIVAVWLQAPLDGGY